jgi:glycosyltransferase involved in cell wall biosynthesis
MSRPLISVVIPFHNPGDFLTEAVESVFAQTYPEIQLILVDDGSTDQSPELAKRFASRADLVTIPQSGIGAALNAGLACCRGQFYCWLDADDLWLPTKVQEQVEFLNANPEFDGVFTKVEQFRQDDGPAPAGGVTARGALMLCSESFHRVGRWQEGLKVGEFLDWYARAQELGLKFGVLTETLYRRRIHGNNTVTRERDSKQDYIKVLKSALDRRRQV